MLPAYKNFLLVLCVAGAPVAAAQVVDSGRAGGSVEQRLERIERTLDSRGLLEMLQQLEQLQREISLLRGEIEMQNHHLQQLTSRQRDLYTDVDQRLQRLERGTAAAEDSVDISLTRMTGDPPLQTLPGARDTIRFSTGSPADSPLQVEIIDSTVDRSPPPADAQGAGEAADDLPAAQRSAGGRQPGERTESVDPLQLQAEYQQAFNLLKQSLYDQAIRSFQEFLIKYPGERYADNAQYWLAEAYYVKREFEQALVEYRKVIDKYPGSQKLNDARLKIGFTLYELGEPGAAGEQLQDLLDAQPGPTIARLATERLRLISSQQQSSSATPLQP